MWTTFLWWFCYFLKPFGLALTELCLVLSYCPSTQYEDGRWYAGRSEEFPPLRSRLVHGPSRCAVWERAEGCCSRRPLPAWVMLAQGGLTWPAGPALSGLAAPSARQGVWCRSCCRMSQPHGGELPASSRAPVKSAAAQACTGLLAAFTGSGALVVPLPLSDRAGACGLIRCCLCSADCKGAVE